MASFLSKINDWLTARWWRKYGWTVECNLEYSPDVKHHYYEQLNKFKEHNGPQKAEEGP